MEVITPSLPPLAILAAAGAIFLLLLRMRRRPKLPPGPWGVPLLCSLPFVKSDLHRYFAGLAKTHGPIFSIRFGTKLNVVISSPALATELFTTHDAVFSNHAMPSLVQIAFKSRSILLSPYGPYWRTARRMVVYEVLSRPAIGSFQPLRRRELQRVLAELRSGLGTPVVIKETAFSILLNVLLGMLWGNALDAEEGSAALRKKLIEILDVLTELFSFFNVADYFPVLGPLDLQGLRRKVTATIDRLDLFLDSIIDRSSSAGRRGVRSYLQIMLDLAEKKDMEVPIGIAEIKALTMEMLFGGSETTAMTIQWAMTELMRHPRAMAKLQEELDTVVGRDCAMEESHIPQLQYLPAVLKETMRLYPTVPLLIPRYPSETCNVGGYTIPKGTSIFINAWAIQRDPSVWSEPLEFRPERFLEHPDKQGKSVEFMPFGGGRRTCPGAFLAETIVQYTIGSLVHAFRWELPEGSGKLEVVDTYSISLHKKDPLVLVPFSR